jgi:mono/diheme cytochrome c family protein
MRICQSRLLFASFMLALISLWGCTAQQRKSDAELGLNPQQAMGRKIYDSYCYRCHEPYSSAGKKGPSLRGVFKQQYLEKSGLPATDERVGTIIVAGRNMMPGFGQVLDQQQVQELLAYLHTL